jgi:uncharacterized repeat protein (TIGR01451 family)
MRRRIQISPCCAADLGFYRQEQAFDVIKTLKRLKFNRSQRWVSLMIIAAIAGAALSTALPSSAQTAKKFKTPIFNRAAFSYFMPGSDVPVEGTSAALQTQPLIDPLGQVTGCAGEILPDYTGFSVGIYDADPTDSTGTSLGRASALTVTEIPDNPNNSIPLGKAPNVSNTNPFFLTNGDKGTYNFLFDQNRGQLNQGRIYILVVQPPANSIYAQRRVKLVIGQRTGNAIAYQAISLDNRPINITDGSTSVNGILDVTDAETIGLDLRLLQLGTSVCQAAEVKIIKSADRVTAQPGDTVIYHLSITNLASAALNNLVVTDTLPVGFNLNAKSVRAELGGVLVPVTITTSGRTVNLQLQGLVLPSKDSNAVLNIAYAATLTPDALRGNGENRALIAGRRVDNALPVLDGPALHRLRVQSGIISDAGTIIGRVFVDKNFDGEQQPNEPGVPNAVIFMEDGNRITTDPNGLFSVTNVLPGHHTGVLDLTSLPGYTLAPNLYVRERNSQSRLVNLAPGGMVRMNFAVTPAFEGGQKK